MNKEKEKEILNICKNGTYLEIKNFDLSKFDNTICECMIIIKERLNNLEIEFETNETNKTNETKEEIDKKYLDVLSIYNHLIKLK